MYHNNNLNYNCIMCLVLYKYFFCLSLWNLLHSSVRKAWTHCSMFLLSHALLSCSLIMWKFPYCVVYWRTYLLQRNYQSSFTAHSLFNLMTAVNQLILEGTSAKNWQKYSPGIFVSFILLSYYEFTKKILDNYLCLSLVLCFSILILDIGRHTSTKKFKVYNCF